ncbi:MAG: MFS transporter, partial [Peptococcaceae bacterium]|nr:MFS transporter [Peptococcaceae bacterium]
GIVVLVLGIVFATSSVVNAFMSYTVYYAVIAGLMLVSLTIFLLTVREPAWAKQMQEDTRRYQLDKEEVVDNENRKLSKGEKRSLILILLSVALWYFGYNAVTSKYAVYATNILDMNYNTTMLLAQGAAIVAYLPAGMIASKIGRKKTILAGVLILATAFGAASFMRAGSPVMVMNLIFITAGVGWATINVNSFPMAVELSSGSNVGKYTGYYYTASMAAQTATPLVSGFLMDTVADTVLFPYATLFVALAFTTMFFVKHGDNKVEAKKGLDAFDLED